MRRRSAAFAASIGLAVSLTISPITASPASAAPPKTDVPGGFASWDELFAMQQRLVAAADAITAAAKLEGATNPSGALKDETDTAGLAGISAKPERKELWVYWKGMVPDTVSRVVDQQRVTVPVKVFPARHSRNEMRRAADRLARVPGVTMAEPRVDGSAVAISTAGGGAGALLGTPATLVAAGGVPVVSGVDSRPTLAASRQNDASPFSGGGMYTYPVGDGFVSLCTTGFAIRYKRGLNITRMLSAGHCADLNQAIDDGAGQPLGTVVSDNNARDTLLINATVKGETYFGPWSGSSRKPVVMAIGAYVDTLVCTTGAMTGQHCNIRVKATGLTINVGYPVGPVVRADKENETIAVGQGDSGGPVVAQDSQFGVINNYAAGTITAQDPTTAVNCDVDGDGTEGGDDVAYETNCAWRVFYVDIIDSLDYYKATIVKG
jgi:hypothetical protein